MLYGLSPVSAALVREEGAAAVAGLARAEPKRGGAAALTAMVARNSRLEICLTRLSLLSDETSFLLPGFIFSSSLPTYPNPKPRLIVLKAMENHNLR
jgi:hypothetical protein